MDMIWSDMLASPFWGTYFALLSFFFGACIGSFLNVCIYRIPREESVVKPRSHCPHCGRLIAWYDNIPLISWIALRARCRYCHMRISARYVIVELLVAVLFLWLWLMYHETPLVMLVYWLVTCGLVLGTFVDLEHLIIPDRVTLGGIVAGLVLSPLAPALHHTTSWQTSLLRSVIGLVVGWGSLWLVRQLGQLAFKKEAMGFGDVKLLGAMGAFFGWQGVLFIIIASSFAGSIVGVSMIFFGGKEWQSRIPYGPYLALAAIAWMLGGYHLWSIYINWLTGPV